MVVKKWVHTPIGIVEKTLTKDEVIARAKEGDAECRLEIAKELFNKADTVEKKIAVILKFLQIEGDVVTGASP